MRPLPSLPCTGTLGRGSGRHWQSLFGELCALLQMIMVFDLQIGGCGYFGRKSANLVFVVLLYVVDLILSCEPWPVRCTYIYRLSVRCG